MSFQNSHTWDFPICVIRDDENDGLFASTNSFSSFGSSNSWMWPGEEMRYGGSSVMRGQMFDFLGEPSEFHSKNYFSQSSLLSEPASPSSQATGPTATSDHSVSNQHLVMMSSSAAHRQDMSGADDYDDDQEDAYSENHPNKSGSVGSCSRNKKQRKTYVGDSNVNSTSSYIDRNGRKKKYDAPPGVWRNSGGFISTVYINKKRVYGPLRRDVADAVRDREEMSVAKTAIHTEEGMRAFVQSMKERCGPNRVACTDFDKYNSPRVSAKDSTITANGAGSNQVYNIMPGQQHSSRNNRPLRAAAKRNIYIGSSEEEDCETDVPVVVPAGVGVNQTPDISFYTQFM